MAENIQYKDAVFRSYFKDKHRVLSLYRAVSGDNSLTEDDIELNDLAEALVNGKRNDVSFIGSFQQKNLLHPAFAECNRFFITYIICEACCT